MAFKQLIRRCVVLCMLVCGLAACSRPAQKPYVAVIAKSTESAFWQAVYAGVSVAANEYNVRFTFEGPENEEQYEVQNEMLERAVENGADVIVLSAIDYYNSAAQLEQAADRGVKIIIIDSDVSSNRVDVRIGTDNYEAGKMAAQALFKQVPEGELRIGIVNYAVHTENGQMRERGFLDALANEARATVLETVNVQSNIPSAMAGAKMLLSNHPNLNAIVTFNEWTSLGVGSAIRESGRQNDIAVVAFDNQITLIEMLETGEIDALIVQNPFAIGYLGIESACKLLKKAEVEPKITTRVTAVTRDNMYSSDIQKILFQFVE